MENKNVAFIAIILALVLLVSGCGVQYTQEELDNQINDAKIAEANEWVSKVDEAVTAKESVEAEKAVLDDKVSSLETELAGIVEVEIAESIEEAIAEVIANAYLIDEVALDGNFAIELDNDDYDKLVYVDVDYGTDTYVAEETLTIYADVKPVLNIDDFDGEIAVEISAENSIVYLVELDESIKLDEDEDLIIPFLGKELNIISYDGTDLEYRLSEKYSGAVDSVITVEGKAITIKAVNDDSDKVLLIVDGEYGMIDEGDNERINGIEIYAENIIASGDFSYIELYIGTDISEIISDGDEYEADETFEWIVVGSGDEIVAVGLQLVERYDDDDEVLLVGDSISLPNDYLKIVFDSIKNEDLKDLEIDISKTEIDIEFAGVIEVDGDKVDDGKLTILSDLTYEYDYKDDKKVGTNLSLIVILNSDRELSLDINATSIVISDADVTYEFEYEFGDEAQFSASYQDALEINDDDNYRIVNGDLLYKSEIYEDDKETVVKIGLVSDDECELVLRVE